MTEREAAMLDHAYATGMKQALAMAAQGAGAKASDAAERLRREALRVLRTPGERGDNDAA